MEEVNNAILLTFYYTFQEIVSQNLDGLVKLNIDLYLEQPYKILKLEIDEKNNTGEATILNTETKEEENWHWDKKLELWLMS